jgi:hypothetical protein
MASNESGVSKKGITHVNARCLSSQKPDGYFPARIFGPLRGQPNSGAKTQKSNRPANNGTKPTTATTMPVVPPSPIQPQTIKTMPATMRTIRPVVEAMKVQKEFISISPLNGGLFIYSSV